MGLRRGWRRPSAVAGFRPIAVPDAFNAGSLTRHAFRSHVEWYRVRFVVPRVAGTTGWKLRFEAVSGRADVFYRGRRVGSNDLPFLPFEVPLPGARPGVNEAVVRVDGRRAATPLLPASRPAGWWNYGGIVREVYLRRIGAFDVSDLEVKAEPGSPARVRLSARARNTTRRVTRLGYRIAVRGPGGFARRVRGAGPRVEPGGDAP
ncbi:MAG TPA: hypothetical protein VE662_01320, partial [Solirubrobacterales bacterium]|nr:hypothetical protein [Solirubrobacterales bacterium]